MLEDGDLVFLGNDLVMIDDPDELAQEVEITLQTNRGEWFLDESRGLNFEAILRKKPNPDELRQEIAATLGQIERINRLESLSVEFDSKTRSVAINLHATGSAGVTIEKGVTIRA